MQVKYFTGLGSIWKVQHRRPTDSIGDEALVDLSGTQLLLNCWMSKQLVEGWWRSPGVV